MAKVTTALIPAAGLGTRFLPATKTVPKEMLPIVDQPILLHIVEECVRAGMTEIVLVSGRGKTAIENFFDRSYELEDHLEKAGKTDLLERMVSIRNMANVISIRQKEALGLGHAVLCGQPVIGDRPFAVLLGDEIMFAEPGQTTVTGQLVNLFEETSLSSVAVMEVPEAEVKKYGVIACEELGKQRYKVKSVVEKPEISKAPSRLALPGRYVFTAEIFKYISDTKPGKNGEIQLTDAMTQIAKNEGLLATEFEGLRYDAGDKLGYLQANIEFGLRNSELSTDLKKYIKNLAGRL